MKGKTVLGLVPGEQMDYYHELIITQELSRMGARGYGDGLWGGGVIGCPPVLNFGSKALQDKIIPDVSVSLSAY